MFDFEFMQTSAQELSAVEQKARMAHSERARGFFNCRANITACR
jgi:hypothetical protein